MNDLAHMSMEELLHIGGRGGGGFHCDCGQRHGNTLNQVKIGQGAVNYLPEAMHLLKVDTAMIVCDRNTRAAALDAVTKVLDKEKGLYYKVYCFDQEHVEPDEHAVGQLCIAYGQGHDFLLYDCVIAVGSGVINDCCRMLVCAVGCPLIVVGTAPSMDGYASHSSSMIRNRVKVTLPGPCPHVIIADTDIMKDAPERMLWAGLGDMLAKYIALCEWRISHLVTGESYCENIANLMRASLKKVVDAAPRLMERDPEVIGTVAEGLILSGMAMAFAGKSRPASGLEHYFSHLWEMFALERGLPQELHGIQVGVGTYLTLRIYDRLKTMTPSRERAEAAMRAFNPEAWEQNVRRVFGKAAQTLIDSEYSTWHKNDPVAHQQRLERILAHWDDILRIIDEELPDTEQIIALMGQVGMPIHPADIGESEQDVYDAFLSSRDIRDKYLTSSLLWDLGLLGDFPLDL